MRRFDVCTNPDARQRHIAPYFVVLSSHLLFDLDEAIVAPLILGRAQAIPGLEVEVVVEDQALVLVVSDIFSVRRSILNQVVTSLGDQEDAIRRALDRLFTGF